MLYLRNALSLNMYPRSGYRSLYVHDLTLDDAAMLAYIARNGLYNAIGHRDTDALLRELLQGTFPFPSIPQGARHTIILTPQDAALVAQYRGPRLPEHGKLQPVASMFVFSIVLQVDRASDSDMKNLIRAYEVGAEMALASTQDTSDIRLSALWSVAMRAEGVHPRTLLEFVLWEKSNWQNVCGAGDSEGADVVRDDTISDG